MARRMRLPPGRPVTVSEVRVGQRVTELDSPAGPYYPVLATRPGELVVDAAAPGDAPLPVRLRYAVRTWLRVLDD